VYILGPCKKSEDYLFYRVENRQVATRLKFYTDCEHKMNVISVELFMKKDPVANVKGELLN